jgi:hypothetical protein
MACILAGFDGKHNEKVFHCFVAVIFWKTESVMKSMRSGHFLKMKKYSEKIEK